MKKENNQQFYNSERPHIENQGRSKMKNKFSEDMNFLLISLLLAIVALVGIVSYILVKIQ
jgi:flagellar biogenesis protein FliO